jgi:hypothetical protein
MDPEIKDVYFRRFVVPIVITLLILLGIAVIIATPPGSTVNFAAMNSVFANVNKNPSVG